MSGTKSLSTYICGKGFILIFSFPLLMAHKHANVFPPSIFIAQEPQIPWGRYIDINDILKDGIQHIETFTT